MSNLEGLSGGVVNNWGGIDVNYQPSGFHVNPSGTLFQRYTPVGRIDAHGTIRGDYDMPTGLGMNHGVIGRDISW